MSYFAQYIKQKHNRQLLQACFLFQWIFVRQGQESKKNEQRWKNNKKINPKQTKTEQLHCTMLGAVVRFSEAQCTCFKGHDKCNIKAKQKINTLWKQTKNIAIRAVIWSQGLKSKGERVLVPRCTFYLCRGSTTQHKAQVWSTSFTCILHTFL